MGNYIGGLLNGAKDEIKQDVKNELSEEFGITVHDHDDDYLRIDAHLSEFDTAQKKYLARVNLNVEIIDGGTFF